MANLKRKKRKKMAVVQMPRRMSLGERVKLARQRKGMNQSELARAVGVAPQSIQYLEGPTARGSRHLPQIAAVTGVSIKWLSEGIGPIEPSNISPAPEVGTRVPLISWVQAGSWMEIVDNYAPGDGEDFIPVPGSVGPHAFALRVSGDSMEPEFAPGDLIIVDPDKQASTGSYVVVRLESSEEATFKQLIIDGGRKYLKPLNPRYPVIDVTQDATITGVVAYKYKPY